MLAFYRRGGKKIGALLKKIDVMYVFCQDGIDNTKSGMNCKSLAAMSKIMAVYFLNRLNSTSKLSEKN